MPNLELRSQPPWLQMPHLIPVLLFLSYQVDAFQVLPFVHIDYEHYYRLANCQAQCAEKYGSIAYKRRMDGSTRSYFNTTSQHYNMCQLGCQNARSPSAPTGRTRSIGDDAFKDGQQFWLNGAQPVLNKKSTPSSTQSAERSPIAALKILCLRPSSSAQANGFLDTYSALLSAQPHRVEFLAPARYLIQWKQRIPLNSKDQRFDETKWITASIEPDLSFTAEGIQPGVQYRFMVTVISPTGRMGAAVTSDWLDAPPLGSPIPTTPLPLIVTPQFNSDDNVSAVVSFRREATSNRRMVAATTCAYHLRYTNASQQVYAHDFEMDESEGFLLTNLAFNTQYDVELQPLSSLPSDTNIPADGSTKGTPSSAQFRTIACADVFGGGSMQCEPEPVRDLDIRINEENSTVLLTWRPSTEPRHVLLYELRYVPVAGGPSDCALDESTMYLPAKTTSAELLIPGDAQCEVEVYLTNFDLRGREASLTARFVYRPKQEENADNATFYGFDSLSTNIWIIISAPLLVIVALLVILRFAAVGQRKLKKKIGGLTVKDETTRTLDPKIRCNGVPPPVNV